MPTNENVDIDDAQDRDVDLGDQQHDESPAWTPPASQEEFDRILTKRMRQLERQKYSDYDSLKSKAEEYDTLAAASKTDTERAVEEAQVAGFTAAMESTLPRLVRAEFRAAAKGMLADDQLEALIEDLDLTRYVDDDGEPDLPKIQRKIKAVAPKAPPPNFGQGNRGPSRTSDMNTVIRQMAGLK